MHFPNKKKKPFLLCTQLFPDEDWKDKKRKKWKISKKQPIHHVDTGHLIVQDEVSDWLQRSTHHYITWRRESEREFPLLYHNHRTILFSLARARTCCQWSNTYRSPRQREQLPAAWCYYSSVGFSSVVKWRKWLVRNSQYDLCDYRKCACTALKWITLASFM